MESPMQPYALPDAEADLRAAIDSGDADRITTVSTLVDTLEQPRAAPSLHAAALWYAGQGLHVFSLQPLSKIPFKRSRGCKDATTDIEQVNRWWTAEPEANIGIATGHLVDVVDIDGALGQQSRAANWEMFDALHVLGKVSTPRPGGLHFYVPATTLGNKAGLLPGIDYRGDGGYVVAPPSRTEQGAYRFLTPLQLPQDAA